MVQNGIFWTIGEQSYFVYYPIILYEWIKFYRFEIIDMGIYHWNNGITGTFIISVSTTVLFVRDKKLWYDSYYDLHSYVESYVKLRLITIKKFI